MDCYLAGVSKSAGPCSIAIAFLLLLGVGGVVGEAEIDVTEAPWTTEKNCQSVIANFKYLQKWTTAPQARKRPLSLPEGITSEMLKHQESNCRLRKGYNVILQNIITIPELPPANVEDTPEKAEAIEKFLSIVDTELPKLLGAKRYTDFVGKEGYVTQKQWNSISPEIRRIVQRKLLPSFAAWLCVVILHANILLL